MTMIERVARAIAQSRHGRTATDEEDLQDARAAILALREPSEEMISAGYNAACSDRLYIKGSWRAMIDAALNDHSS